MKVPKCYVCRHPKLQEINEAFVRGMMQSEIIRTIAPDLPKSSINYHFRNDHHLRDMSEYQLPTGVSIPIKPSKPSKPLKPTTRGTTQTTKADLKDTVKVHWEIPRSLLKDLKIKAINQDQATIELVRQYLRYGMDHL